MTKLPYAEILCQSQRYGVEFKRVDAPSVTPSMKIALEDLELEQLAVLYPGHKAYRLAEQINVIPLATLATDEAGQHFTLGNR
ncbi:MAG: hypothetical protein HY711_05900 [Candidatus Melainabacteria bacterium]|nr:hypothetical protein [Candidatus Melainabacteria bacterium]